MAHLSSPLFILVGLVWWSSPHHYDPAKYQFLVGKTNSEVKQILGRDRSSGYTVDDHGFSINYSGMRIRYSLAPGNRDGPEPNDIVIAVEKYH